MMKCFRGALIKPTTHTFLSDWSFWLIDKGPLRCGLHGKSKYLIDFFLPRPTNTIAKCTLQIWSSSMAQKPVSWYSDTVPLLLFFFSCQIIHRTELESKLSTPHEIQRWTDFALLFRIVSRSQSFTIPSTLNVEWKAWKLRGIFRFSGNRCNTFLFCGEGEVKSSQPFWCFVLAQCAPATFNVKPDCFKTNWFSYIDFSDDERWRLGFLVCIMYKEGNITTL